MMDQAGSLWQALMAGQQQPQAPMNDYVSPQDFQRQLLEQRQRRNSAVMRQVGPNDALAVPDRNTFMPLNPEDPMSYRHLLMPYEQERL